jgi:CRP-like cAMP-binding protein
MNQRTRSDASGPTETNELLRALSSRDYAAFLPELELVTLVSGDVLYVPDAPIEWVYFPQSCVASMVRHMADGASVEVGTIGREGVVGVSTAFGATSMPTECVIQIAGTARRTKRAAFLAAMARRPQTKSTETTGTFSEILLRYSQALFEQVAQSAACNRLHALEQRCARWLLMTHDRVDGDVLALTQQFLSYMLGVRRAGVTEACGSLQRSGLIQYRHGRITITDRPGLEAAACECFHVGVQAYRELLGPLLKGNGREQTYS